MEKGAGREVEGCLRAMPIIGAQTENHATPGAQRRVER